MPAPRGINWVVEPSSITGNYTWEQVQATLLMEIRDELEINTRELRRLNELLHCPNFVRIPFTLRRLLDGQRQTTDAIYALKPKRRVVKRKKAKR